MNQFEKALRVSGKALKRSSQSIYACMWKGFCDRLAAQGAVPGHETTTQLAIALEGAGDYGTQKRLHRLVHWVYLTLVEHGQPLSDHTVELEKMYISDSRAQHEGLSITDMARLEHAAIRDVKGWKGLRLAAIVALLAHAGLRQQELLTLEKTDVWWDGDGQAYLAIRRKKASRIIPLSDACGARIHQWLENYPVAQAGRWLFVADTAGNPLDGSTVWRQLKRLCARELGENAVSQFGTGIIRASLAKSLQADGLSTTELREFLGHRQEASTAELLSRVSINGAIGTQPRNNA